MPAPAPLQLSIVLGILQLSHKYDVLSLYKHALNHLAAGWYAETYDGDLDNHLIYGDSTPLSVIDAALEVGTCERARKIVLSRLLDDVFEVATDPFHCAEVEEYFESFDCRRIVRSMSRGLQSPTARSCHRLLERASGCLWSPAMRGFARDEAGVDGSANAVAGTVEEVIVYNAVGRGYFMPDPAPLQLSIVLGILQLSHKYDVPYLYKRALDHLAAGWYAETYDGDLDDHLIYGDGTPAYSLSVIDAALEVGAHWLLPFAYQCAATFSAKQLLPFLEGKMGQYALKSLAAHEQMVHGTISIQHFLIRS
ncbi:hypothetical protein B0H14DRAFT_3739058 [Mycena olivaceomarginata]|nr:hypothetical protein B0H14DRAFT_3739058 [Mycena olivaceomarginata]